MDPEPQPDTEAAAPPPAADAAPDASGKGSKKGKGLGKKRGSASQDQQDAASTTTEGATQEQPPRKGITKKGPAAAPVLDLAGTIEKIEEAVLICFYFGCSSSFITSSTTNLPTSLLAFVVSLLMDFICFAGVV